MTTSPATNIQSFAQDFLGTPLTQWQLIYLAKLQEGDVMSFKAKQFGRTYQKEQYFSALAQMKTSGA